MQDERVTTSTAQRVNVEGKAAGMATEMFSPLYNGCPNGGGRTSHCPFFLGLLWSVFFLKSTVRCECPDQLGLCGTLRSWGSERPE